MRFNFRTVSRISLLLVFVFLIESEASIIHKHKAKLVRVVRDNEAEKTKLADGTKFERFVEKGDLPPLPIEDEEEADDLNDPRIGHLDKDGGIAVPVDSNGNVLKGFEYLLKPITIVLDFEESSKNEPSGDRYEIPKDSQNGNQKDYKPYHNSQDLAPKPEFLPDEQETTGEEYDDMASEPKEFLPNIPDLPKPIYSDSGEIDEDLMSEDGVGEDEDDAKVTEEDLNNSERRIVGEVIVPSSNIELPISQDEVNESNKSADEVEQQTEIRSDEDDNERDRNVNIPSNRIEEEEQEESEDVYRGGNNEEDVASEMDKDEVELTEEDLEDLAKDLGKGVFENVMNKASEFAGSTWESEASEDSNVNGLDPNSISAQARIPSDTEDSGVEVVEAEDMDGVVLPDEELSDEDLARIAAESSKPKEPVVPQVPTPSSRVRGGRIGSGVQPNSASQHNILIQFITVALVFLLV